jgi:acyl dehydratase
MALGMLYAKAAATSVLPRPSTLPDTTIRRDVPVDRAHLAAYDRVCGFRFGDSLPAPYPFVLSFAAQMELMAGRAFPFALPGLVHVRNTIRVHRAIDAAETLTLVVHAERLRSHPKGAQVDLVTEVDAAGERVWESRSTYFARGASAAAGRDDPPPPAGFETGAAAASWRVDAGAGRRYAGVSGDVNPIHISPLAAKAFGFPRAIAHGMWTAAHALAALDGRLPEAFTWDVAFSKPLLLPSTVELRTRPVDGGWDLDVRSAKAPHLAATVRR